MYRVPLLKEFTAILNGPASDFDGYFDISSNNGDEPWELRRTTLPSEEIEPTNSIESLSKGLLKLWKSSYEEDSPDVVTWPSLLRSMYDNQVRAPPRPMISHKRSKNSKGSDGQIEKGKYAESEHTPNDLRAEDRMVVRLVERSWDLVPPDVVR